MTISKLHDTSQPSQQAQKEAAAAEFVETYKRWFESVPVTTEAQKEEVFRLRYQVYVVENPFEHEADHPNGLEMDVYDERAKHVILRHKELGITAGTARIILPDQNNLEASFPLQDHCFDPLLHDPVHFPVPHMAEVSRFCVSKDFRRRLKDQDVPFQFAGASRQSEEKLIMPHITLGLIEGLVNITTKHKISYWCAVMEPQLLRLLKRLGIHFDKIGPLVEFHGRRQPCYQHMDRFLSRIKEERADVWSIVAAEGKHHDTIRDYCQPVPPCPDTDQATAHSA